MYFARFFRKNPLWAKSTKYGQKRPKNNRVFPLFRRILSLFLMEKFLNKKRYCYLFDIVIYC